MTGNARSEASAEPPAAPSPEVVSLLARMRAVDLGESAVAASFDPSRGAER